MSATDPPEAAPATAERRPVDSIPPPAPRGIDRTRVLLALAWLIGGAAAVQLIDGFLGASPAAAAVLGAVLVDILAGRAGVRWSDLVPAPWARDLRPGAALGASVGLLLVIAGHTLGWASVVLGAPAVTMAFALVRVVAVAARDELLLRWLPVALGRRAGVPDRALLAFVVGVAVAPLVASSRITAPAVALVAAQALLGGRLAMTTRGALAPAAAHAALVLCLGPLTRGGVLDVTWWSGDPGPGIHADGAAGWLAAAVVTIAALLVPRLLRR